MEIKRRKGVDTESQFTYVNRKTQYAQSLEKMMPIRKISETYDTEAEAADRIAQLKANLCPDEELYVRSGPRKVACLAPGDTPHVDECWVFELEIYYG